MVGTFKEQLHNKKKQRLKGNSTDAFNINSYLEKIENNARDIYYKFKIEGIIPTKNQFKEKLSQKLNLSQILKKISL